MHPITTAWQMIKFDGAAFHEQEDEIVTETPLTIRINGEELATVVCSPDALEDLTVGFLAAEGLIRSIADIEQLNVNEDRGFADVELKVKKSISHDYYAKRFISSCCGKSRQFYFHNDMRTAKTIMSQTRITPEQCISSNEGTFSKLNGIPENRRRHQVKISVPFHRTDKKCRHDRNKLPTSYNISYHTATC